MSRDLPLVLGLSLVVEVDFLEFRAHVESLSQLVMSITRLLTLDASKDLLSVDKLESLVDDGIADFTNENNKL